ncbi:glycosyltransferase [Paenibacillus sp. R14(2021)]|uniref:glycosyltransferase n=1 Tax=Paenibacillus sp. R14(2021) TaxID=2859228 RepID=UPI001C614D42|nr:glycosyltransferase [Paenibacillus sp. R14(2021)]
MNKLNILYFTIDWSTYTYKPDHYFKLELATLPDVHVHFREQGGYLPDILSTLDFIPDFIYMDNFKHSRNLSALPTGMNKVSIPKGILFHDVNRSNDTFRSYVKENKIDLIFVHYRDAFLKYFPKYHDRLRWLPNHAYKPVFHRYNVQKTIDYLMMGRVKDYYPLRKEIIRKMHKLEGFVSHEHPGYRWFTNNEKETLYLDQNYAKEINRAKMFLTCGSKYDFAVGKYFEIPACGTLLLASGFNELEDLGFIHKKTFIEINKSNFMDKAQYYLRHEDVRNAITEKGYELVRSRHTTDIRVREFVDELWKFTGKTRQE